MEGKEEENVHHDDGTQAGNNKGNVVTLDSLNYTNIKVVNGKTNFETLNARETLLSMSKHTSHNGFQLDGFKRLSALSQTRVQFIFALSHILFFTKQNIDKRRGSGRNIIRQAGRDPHPFHPILLSRPPFSHFRVSTLK